MNARMSASAERGEEIWQEAGDLCIADAIEDYGSREIAARAAAEMVGGSREDVLAYFEFNGF